MDKEKIKSRDLPLNQELTESYLKEKARREKDYNAKQKYKNKTAYEDDDFTYKLRKNKRK